MRFFRHYSKKSVAPATPEALRAKAPPLGTRVGVRLWADASASVHGQVSECSDCDFSVDSIRNFVFHPEQHVEVSWSDNDQVHVIAAIVVAGEGNSYKLASTKTRHTLPQLRSNERVPWSRPAQVEIIHSRMWHKCPTVSVQTIDISSGGIRFATSATLAPGDRIKVMMDGYDPMTAEVIRSGNIAKAWRHHISARWMHPIKIPTEN